MRGHQVNGAETTAVAADTVAALGFSGTVIERLGMSKIHRVQPGARRRIDFLRSELDHGRLTQEGFAAGRVVQGVLERAFLLSGSAWQERVDESTGTDAAAVHGLDVARQVVGTMAHVERVVGGMDARILRRLLGDRLTIDEIAAREGRPGPRGSTYLLSRVRDALEQLAEAGHAKGRDRGSTCSSSIG